MIHHRPLWQLPYLKPRSLEYWRYRAWYCWKRAQGHDTRTVVFAGPFAPLPARSRHWLHSAARFVGLSALYAYRSLPGLWYLVRYGPFMLIQWRQWRDFEDRPLSRWPEVKQDVIELHYSHFRRTE